MGKRGQMQLSFGVIFSIILIIIFISFAFYAITKFLDLQGSVKVGQFENYLESDIENMWKSSQGSKEVSYNLPKEVIFLCFADMSIPKRGVKQDLYSELQLQYIETENMFLYPRGSADTDAFEIAHLNLYEITKNDNPYCLDVLDGKVKLTLSKGFNDALVTITR